MFDVENAVVKGEIPSYYYTDFVVCHSFPANKVNPADLTPGTTLNCRPVNTGRSDRCLLTRSYVNDRLQDTYNSLVVPVQNGIGVSGGISMTIFRVQAVVDANPGVGIIQCDIKNGYSEMTRQAILNSI